MSEKAKGQRRYLPTLAELVDRLCITSMKQLFIPEHRREYTAEIDDILHDIDLIARENNVKLDGNLVRDIILLALFNREIWINESNCRKGIKDGNNLEKSHFCNSIRNLAKNRIQEKIGGRKDYKIDSVGGFPELVPSGYEKSLADITSASIVHGRRP